MQAYVTGVSRICEGTRHTGSQGDKCNRINAVFEVDEAAKMASDISNDSGANADTSDGYHKSGVTIGNALKMSKN